MKFAANRQPAEGLGALLLFRLIEDATPSFFDPGRRIVIARAPGRLDVFGGHAGRGGGASLQVATAEAACAAVQLRTDPLVRVWSPSRAADRSQRLATGLADLGVRADAAPGAYDDTRRFLAADPDDRWAAHLLGALLVLAHERGLRPAVGFDLLLHSDVPERCGAASSTAIAVAALYALANAYGMPLPADEAATLADRVAREVVGEVVDAVATRTVVHARGGSLCAGVDDFTALPDALELVGIDLGVARTPLGDASPAPAYVEAENARVARFRALCQTPLDEQVRSELGDLLFAAHRDLAALGRGHERSDFVVDLVAQRRAAGGPVLGAKATGDGGGGTVLLLGEHGKVWLEALRVKKALLARTGHSAHVFRWSSPGAAAFEPIELLPTAP